MKVVYIGIPAYSGQLHCNLVQSIMHDSLKLVERGDKITLFTEVGHGIIHIGRATILGDFLRDSAATDLVWVDSDVFWQPGTLLKLLDHPGDFVAALPPYRADPLNFPVGWLAPGEPIYEDEQKFIQVSTVPFGLVKTSRKCLELMCERYSELEIELNHAGLMRTWDLFSYLKEGKSPLGEDTSFCRRWRNMGGEIWVDPYAKMGHIGFKSFIGSLHEWLVEQGYRTPDAEHGAVNPQLIALKEQEIAA